MLDLKVLTRFLSRDYRDEYLGSHVRSGIAYQVQALRRKFSLSQEEFSQRTGKKQSTVSRLENTEYGKVTVQTLLDIACALDVALVVRFVDYPTFLGTTKRMSEADLQPGTIFESVTFARSMPVINSPYDSSYRQDQGGNTDFHSRGRYPLAYTDSLPSPYNYPASGYDLISTPVSQISPAANNHILPAFSKRIMSLSEDSSHKLLSFNEGIV